MKINDIVFQNYGGVHRYGKVKEVKENFNDVQNLNNKYNVNTYRDKKGRFKKI